jgi:hypothetical protein
VDGVFDGLPEKGWAATPLDLAENDFGLASAVSRRPQRSFVAWTFDFAAAPQLSRLGGAIPARGLARTGLASHGACPARGFKVQNWVGSPRVWAP